MARRIGVDYDGVIADTQGFAIRYMNDHLDLDLTRADFAWRNGRPTIDLDRDLEVDGGFEDFVADTDLIAELDPVDGVEEALWRLSDDPKFTPVVATHRPGSVHGAIEQWLADYDLPPIEVLAGIPEEKAQTTPSLDVLVDDYHGHADAATRRGLLGVHLTVAWTSGDPTLPGTVSAQTWDEVLAAITGEE